MTEKEKMLSGKPYKGFNDELVKERQYAKEVLYDFNSLRPSEIEKRNEWIGKLFGRVGKEFYIEPPFRCDYGYNISIGENFYSNYNCTILDCAPVTIGNNVLFGPNVSLFTAGHPFTPSHGTKESNMLFRLQLGIMSGLAVESLLIQVLQ